MRRQRGFSLIELLFALVVLTIVITTSLAIFVERTNRSQRASELILAYQALSNETEVIRRISYGSLDTLTDDCVTRIMMKKPKIASVNTVSSRVNPRDAFRILAVLVTTGSFLRYRCG